MIIDNYAFAKKQLEIKSSNSIKSFTRVIDLLPELNGDIFWSIKGEFNDKPTIILKICGKITTLCQNCLEILEINLEQTTRVPIFNSEEELEKSLFSETSSYDDGILNDSEFDVLNFVEDELILILPLAPKHESCVHKITSNNDNLNQQFKQVLNSLKGK